MIIMGGGGRDWVNICIKDLVSPVESNHRPLRKYDCMRVTTLMAKELVSYTTSSAATTGQMEKRSIYLWVTFLKQKAKKITWEDHVAAFKT